MKPMDGPLRDTGCCPRLPIGKTIRSPARLTGTDKYQCAGQFGSGSVCEKSEIAKKRKDAKTPGKKKNLALYGFQTS